VQKGDKDAFASLVNQNAKECYYFAYRFLGDKAMAQDAVSECFYRVWHKRSTWQNTASVKTWLFTIIYHWCIDEFRLSKKITELNIELVEGNEYLPETRLSETAKQQQIRKLILELEPRERAMLVMHYYQGLKQKEIAEIFYCSVKVI